MERSHSISAGIEVGGVRPGGGGSSVSEDLGSLAASVTAAATPVIESISGSLSASPAAAPSGAASVSAVVGAPDSSELKCWKEISPGRWMEVTLTAGEKTAANTALNDLRVKVGHEKYGAQHQDRVRVQVDFERRIIKCWLDGTQNERDEKEIDFSGGDNQEKFHQLVNKLGKAIGSWTLGGGANLEKCRAGVHGGASRGKAFSFVKNDPLAKFNFEKDTVGYVAKAVASAPDPDKAVIVMRNISAVQTMIDDMKVFLDEEMKAINDKKALGTHSPEENLLLEKLEAQRKELDGANVFALEALLAEGDLDTQDLSGIHALQVKIEGRLKDHFGLKELTPKLQETAHYIAALAAKDRKTYQEYCDLHKLPLKEAAVENILLACLRGKHMGPMKAFLSGIKNDGFQHNLNKRLDDIDTHLSERDAAIAMASGLPRYTSTPNLTKKLTILQKAHGSKQLISRDDSARRTPSVLSAGVGAASGAASGNGTVISGPSPFPRAAGGPPVVAAPAVAPPVVAAPAVAPPAAASPSSPPRLFGATKPHEGDQAY